jgi:hypothetical protein
VRDERVPIDELLGSARSRLGATLERDAEPVRTLPIGSPGAPHGLSRRIR